ncbi:Crp/Fnr family transcriptional regulator [Pedobacter duraquae]|nr:cyclic nucleotide-binding domain-containing protein [Pedobacter duraquae]
MQTDLINDFLFGGHELPAELALETERKRLDDFFSIRAVIKEYPKGYLLLAQDQIPNRIYYLIDGMAEGSIENMHGERRVTHAFMTGAFPVDGFMFPAARPSKFFCRTLIKSKLISLSRVDVEKLFEKFPYTKIVLNYIAENNLRNSNAELLSAYNKSIDRLKAMNAQWPGIERIAPRGFIADLVHMSQRHIRRLIAESNKNPDW